MNRLGQRVKKLEGKAGSKELRAAIQGLLTPLGPDDPALRAGVDDEGEALFSRGGRFGFSRAREINKRRASRN